MSGAESLPAREPPHPCAASSDLGSAGSFDSEVDVEQWPEMGGLTLILPELYGEGQAATAAALRQRPVSFVAAALAEVMAG